MTKTSEAVLSSDVLRALHLVRPIRWVVPIFSALQRVVSDVITNATQLPVIADDSLVVASLPNRRFGCVAQGVDTFRSGGLESTDDGSERAWLHNSMSLFPGTHESERARRDRLAPAL